MLDTDSMNLDLKESNNNMSKASNLLPITQVDPCCVAPS